MVITSEVITIALQSLWRNKLRSILTMLGIIIGVASVILLISIGHGLEKFITQQFESLGSNLVFIMPGKLEGGGAQYTSRNSLTFKTVNDLSRIGYPITNVTGEIETFTTVSNKGVEKSYQVVGIDTTGIKMMNYEAEKGRLFSKSEVEKRSKVALIGPKAAEALFSSSNPVGKYVFIQKSKYKVVGVFKSKGGGMSVGPSQDEIIIIPITTAQTQFDMLKPSAILAKVATSGEMDNAKKLIESKLAKTLEEDEYSVLGQEDLLSTITQILGVVTAALGGIAAISLLVGGIGIMNIMFVSVTERTKEIGLRKALGATPGNILIQFLIESVTLSLVGGGIGVGIATLGSVALSTFFASTITPDSVVLAFGFSTVIGIIFGVAPAWKAAKMDPIQALRYE